MGGIRGDGSLKDRRKRSNVRVCHEQYPQEGNGYMNVIKTIQAVVLPCNAGLEEEAVVSSCETLDLDFLRSGTSESNLTILSKVSRSS